MEEEKKEEIREETTDYGQKGIMDYFGAIVGGVIALILCFTQFYRFVLAVAIIAAGVFLGNYIQKNKAQVKDKLKNFIDKF